MYFFSFFFLIVGFAGVINFIVPFILYFMALRYRRREQPRLIVNVDYESDSNTSTDIATHTVDHAGMDGGDVVFPKFMRKWSWLWVLVLLGVMTVLILIQIILSLYYQLALHKNILSD